jgi:hypothetical protein
VPYTDPTTGLIWVKTEPLPEVEPPAELADASPYIADVGQGVRAEVSHVLDMARMWDHTYWAEHKDQFQKAADDGSLTEYLNRN